MNLPFVVSSEPIKKIIVNPSDSYARYLEARGAEPIKKSITVITHSSDEFKPVLIKGEAQNKSHSNIFTSRLMLLDKQRGCVALLLKNNGDHDVHIEVPRVSSRGTRHIPKFIVKSDAGNKYKYVGPLDMRRDLPLSGYTVSDAGSISISFHCMDKFYDFEGKVSTIQYNSIFYYYRLIYPRTLEILGYQDLSSNIVKMLGQP